MIYLYNLLAIPLYYFIIRANTNKIILSNKLFFIVVATHVILFRVLANPYNYVDTERYADAFYNIAEMTFSDAVLSINYYSAWGIGYVALNWFIAHFLHNIFFLFAISSVFSIGGTILFYKKSSYVALAPIILYLIYPMMYFMGFGVIRQHLSIPFLLFALYYINNLKISIPLIIVSVLLHTGAIIFIPFYFLVLFYRSHSLKVSFFLSTILVVLLRTGLLFILSFLPRYEETYETREATNNIVPVFLIGVLLYLLYLSKIWKCVRISSPKEYNIILFLLYGFFVSVFSIGVSSAGRLTLPFIYALPVAMTYLLKYKSKTSIFYRLYFIIFLSVTIVLYFLKYKADGLLTYSYSFYWEPQILYY